MPIRRKLTGQPLLVASAGALLISCSGKGKTDPIDNVGNLMPAPRIIELCVDTSPPQSQVTIDGQRLEGRCLPFEGEASGKLHIEVSAEGYATKVLDIVLSADPQPLFVALEPIATEPIAPPEILPVGNLMSPQ